LLDVKAANFEGPLDLLIHLIYKNEMNIYDISISTIADQFVDTLRKMESLDIEIAAEFINMASYLTYLKSKMLLPKTSTFEEDMDPEEEKFLFTQRIIEYSFYKDVALTLKEKEFFSSRYLSRKDTLYLPKENLFSEDPMKLVPLFFDLINKKKENNVVIEHDNVDIEDLICQMKDFLLKRDSTFWSEIVNVCNSRKEIVSALFAILELVRLKTITAVQNENFGEILVKKYV
jgi:segregation and condensation protein A